MTTEPTDRSLIGSGMLDSCAPLCLRFTAGLLLLASLCHGQQVALPQCPQYAGNPQVSASCTGSVSDIVFDATGTVWIADSLGRVLRFPGIKVGQIPSSNQTADLVLGKPSLTTLTNGSCQACSIGVPVKLAFDSQGALWVADQNSGFAQPPMLHRFSPPFASGQAADFVAPAYYAGGGMAFDGSGNLWIASPYLCGGVLRYAPPFSATMQPNLVLGQPSTSSSSCVSSPGPNVLNGVQGLAFGSDGSLFVGDTASSRIAVFKPPFQTFMSAAYAIGQANLTSYQPVSFEQGGVPDVVGLAIDPGGRLWVLDNNNQYLSVYDPPFSAGITRAAWFDFVTGQTSNGTIFPYALNGYSSIRFAPDSSLWLASSGVYTGLGTFAILTPAALQLLELSPSISFIGSAATATSPFTAGQLISIYGTQLGPPSGSPLQLSAAGAVTTSNAGTQVMFDGTTIAPILYTSAGQVNAVVPCDLAGRASTEVTVLYEGAQSAAVTLPLSAAAPGIFTVNGSGQGQAAVLNQDSSLNGPSNPAARGSVAIFYATGVGVTSPCVDGQTYTSNFPVPTLPVVVGVGNIGASVLYAGQAPDLVSGVAQVNFVVPSDASTGGAVPLTLEVGGIFSPSGVTIAVK
jgi:uncharacterized protein (TIGR03437 family)